MLSGLLVVGGGGILALHAVRPGSPSAKPIAAQPFAPAIPSAGTASSAAGGFTSAQALRFATTWYPTRDAARFANDDTTLATLETGAALTVDQAFTQRIICGCDAPKHLHQLDQAWVVVPPAPVHAFLAQFVTTRSDIDATAVYTVVFVPSAGTWKAAVITLDDAYTKAFLTPADPIHAPPTARAARTELAALGTYLQTWRTTGAAPKDPGMRWSGVAVDTGKYQAAQGQGGTNPVTKVSARFDTPVPGGPTYAFSITGGSMVCGSLLSTAENASRVGPLYQDPAQRNWGAQLAPGTYQTLVVQYEDEICVFNHTSGPREVTAFYGTTIAIGPPAI